LTCRASLFRTVSVRQAGYAISGISGATPHLEGADMESKAFFISGSLNISLFFALVAIFLTRNNLLQPDFVGFWLPVWTTVVVLSFGL
jgi:hypothetical protein